MGVSRYLLVPWRRREIEEKRVRVVRRRVEVSRGEGPVGLVRNSG